MPRISPLTQLLRSWSDQELAMVHRKLTCFLEKGTHPHDQFITDNINVIPAKRIAQKISRSHGYVAGRIKKLGLKKDPEAVERFRKQSRFRKGHVTWNKGKKIESTGRMRETQFKPGNKPHNTKSDGAISVRRDFNGRPYQHIRIAEGEWKHLHRHIWEKEHGPVPDDKILAFKDGDQLNCTLDNLELIDREESMCRARLSDAWLASSLSHVPGKKGVIDPAMKKQVLQHPELLEVQRKRLLINEKVREHGKQ